MIPKIIHQVWMGPKHRPCGWMDSWPRLNPTWEYRLWTEDNFAWPLRNQSQFDATPNWSGKINVLRYELLLEQGGLYIDADCEASCPLDDRLLHSAFLGCYENENIYPGRLNNHVLGARPGHDVLASLIQSISKLRANELTPSWKATGPLLMTKVLGFFQHRWGRDIRILPSWYFAPQHYGRNESVVYKSRSFAVHHWGSTRQLYRGPAEKPLSLLAMVTSHNSDSASKQRAAIRETWASSVPEHVKVLFYVGRPGQEICSRVVYEDCFRRRLVGR